MSALRAIAALSRMPISKRYAEPKPHMNRIDWKKALPAIAAIVLFVVLSLGYFSPLLEGKRLVQGDQKRWLGMAQEIVEHREAHDGEDPLWTGSMFSGMPAYQISVIWKGNLLTYADKLFHGFLPHPAGTVFLYLLAMYFLLRVLRVDPWISLIGALAYGFSSYFLIIFEAGHNSKAVAIGYMPAVLGAVWLLFRGQRWWGAALLALFMGLEITANHLQVTYYLGMLLVLFALAEILRAFREKQLGDFGVRAALGVVAVGLAVLANVGTLWGTAEYGQYTTRGPSDLTIGPDGSSAADVRTGGLDKDYVTQWSYGKQESLSLIVPHVKGGASGSMIQTREDLAALKDPALKSYVTEVYQQGGYVNNYWGDQMFTSGPVYLGVVVVLLMLLMLGRTEGPARWWVLGSIPLVAILIVAVTSPMVAAGLVVAYLLAGLVLWRDPLPYALFSALLLTLLLSWGQYYMPLTDFFLDHVPGYDKFRAVTIILVIVELAAPVLGALYLDRLVKEGGWNKATEKRFLIPAGVLALVLVVIALMPGSFLDFLSEDERSRFTAMADAAGKGADDVVMAANALKDHRMDIVSGDAWRGLLLLIISGGLLFAFGRKKLGAVPLIAGLGLLTLIDLWSVDKRYLNNEKDKGRYRQWEEVSDNEIPFKAEAADLAILQAEENDASKADAQATIERLKERKKNASGRGKLVSPDEQTLARFAALRRNSDFRVLSLRDAFQDARASYFHKSLGGYHGAKLKRYQELIAFHLAPEVSAIGASFKKGATLQSVTDAIGQQHVINMLNTRYIIADPAKPPIPNPHALGSAWFVDEVKWVKNADEEITALGTTDPAATAVVDERWRTELGDGPVTADSTATVTLTSYAANELHYSVHSANGGVVVFSEIWYGPDWHATIDGSPAEHARVDYVLRGMRVPAGDHEIVFRLHSDAFSRGSSMSMAGSTLILLWVLAAAFFQWRRMRAAEA